MDKLISKLSQVIQLNPKNAEARRKRAEFYFYKGEFANCISDSSEVIRLCSRRRPDLCEPGGNANFETGEIDKAISDYTTALKLGAPGVDVLAQDDAGIYTRKGELDKAISDYDEAIPAGAEAEHALRWTRIHLPEAGHADKAFADLRRSFCGINPIDARAYGYRGIAYNHEHKFDEAMKDLNEAIRLNPIDKESHYQRGL